MLTVKRAWNWRYIIIIITSEIPPEITDATPLGFISNNINYSNNYEGIIGREEKCHRRHALSWLFPINSPLYPRIEDWPVYGGLPQPLVYVKRAVSKTDTFKD